MSINSINYTDGNLSQQALNFTSGGNGDDDLINELEKALSSGKTGKVVKKRKKKKDDPLQGLQNIANSLNNNQQGNNISSVTNWTNLLNQPTVMTPLLGALSLASLLGTQQIYKIMKTDNTKIEYTDYVIENIFAGDILSEEGKKKLFTNLFDIIKHPDKIKVPQSYLSLFATPAQKAEAEKEYKKAAYRLASIFLFYPMIVHTDGDGTLFYKSADFVAGTGVCTSTSDRAGLISLVYLLRKINLSLEDYFTGIVGLQFTPEEKEQLQRAALSLTTMRSLWGGTSIYRIPTTRGKVSYYTEEGELVLETGEYWVSTIDSLFTEMGCAVKPKPNVRNLPSMFDLMDINAFGGVLKVKGGDEIIIHKGDPKKEVIEACNRMKLAIEKVNVSSDELNAQVRKLKALTSQAFLDKYEKEYLEGDKKEVYLGFRQELDLVVHALGLGVRETKGIPYWMLDPEWATADLNPRLSSWFDPIADILNNPSDGWKEAVLAKVTPLPRYDESVVQAGKIPIPTDVYNKLITYNNTKEGANAFRAEVYSAMAPTFITAHAIRFDGGFTSPGEIDNDASKKLLIKIWAKYANALGFFGDNPATEKPYTIEQLIENFTKLGGANNGNKAPYCEMSFLPFSKADVLRVAFRNILQTVWGDSQGTDLPGTVKGITMGWGSRRELVQGDLADDKGKRLDYILKYLKDEIGIQDTSLPQEIRERLINEVGMGLGSSPRGQIDLSNNTAIKWYAKYGADPDCTDGPFYLEPIKNGKTADGKDIVTNYILKGELFGNDRNKTISKNEYESILNEKANTNNVLYKALKEKAIPFYTEAIVRPGDTSSHIELWQTILYNFFGIDGEKIDENHLFDRIIPEKYRVDPYRGGPYNLLERDQKEVNEFFGIKAPKDPHSIRAKIIYNAPNAGAYLALVGSMMASVAIGTKIYDNFFDKHPLFEDYANTTDDLIGKGFSLANLGLAATSTFLQTQFYPFQFAGTLSGIASGFIPPGNIQQYLALMSLTGLFLGSARKEGWGYGSYIDTMQKDSAEMMKKAMKYKDASLFGKTYFDPKVPNTAANQMAEELHEKMIRFLHKHLKVSPKISGFLTKPIADFAWNLKALWQTAKEPNLLRFVNKDSATTGVKYNNTPHSLPHFLNLAGFAMLGVLGIELCVDVLKKIFNKTSDQKSRDKDELDIPHLLNPRAKLNKKHKVKTSSVVEQFKEAIEEKTKDDKDKNINNSNNNQAFSIAKDNASRASIILSTVGALIPSFVFLVQGLLLRQNAGGNRFSWMDPANREIRYHPYQIGTALTASAALQGLTAVGSGVASLGLLGNNSQIASNIFHSLYNFFSATSLAASAFNVLGGGGGTIGTLRNRTSMSGIAYTPIPVNS